MKSAYPEVTEHEPRWRLVLMMIALVFVAIFKPLEIQQMISDYMNAQAERHRIRAFADVFGKRSMEKKSNG